MASVINTNTLSMVTQQNLNQSQNALNTSMERLSSGMRINSAKDDAAGQAIANRMDSQITGLSQAQRNANDGISVAQTAEGALNQVNDNLQRVRELSVQAASDTNSAEDKVSIQAEITQRLEEINRISEQTNFNGTSVLAENQTLNIQVGANDGEDIEINLEKVTASTLGLDKLDLTNQLTSESMKEVTGNTIAAVPATTIELTFSGGTVTNPTISVDDEGNLIAEDANNAGQGWAVEYDSESDTLSYDTSQASVAFTSATNQDNFVNDNGDLVSLSSIASSSREDAAAPTFNVYQDQATGSLFVDDGTSSWAIDGTNNTIDMDTGVVTLDTKDATRNTPTATDDQVTTGNVMTVGGTSGKVADMSTIDSDGTNTLMQAENGDYYIKNENDGKTSWTSATVADDGTVTAGEEVVVDPLASIDAALSQVDDLRSDLGALQNRFDSAITNLSTTETNLASAQSRIQDADYADEVSSMTTAQILQQAGTSMLTQANQVPQNVLSLLG